MAKNDIPITQAIRVLKDKNINFVPFQYDYQEKGGTKQTAIELKVDEHSVIKTLIMEPESGDPFVILMHGDMEVSTKELARLTNHKTVSPCDLNKATKYTGYQFGGTSPFGTRKIMNMYAESTIMDLDEIYINGGKRGFIVKIKPQVLQDIFDLNLVNVAIKK